VTRNIGAAAHRAERGTVEEYGSFAVGDLHRRGALRDELVSFAWASFKWPGIVRVVCNRWRIDVELRCGASQRIPVVWTRCHFGGDRPWFMCLKCDRRVGKLYNTGVRLACRRCLDLWYASQRRGAKSRSYLQALKLRLRLNGVASLTAPIPDRPKRMHERTYQRLRRRLERYEREVRNSRRFMLRETDYSVLVPK
jgi:hypothetical protein